MSNSQAIEICALYIPVILMLITVLSVRIYPRLRIAILLATLWQAATLPWINFVATQYGWWSFSPSPWQIFGMPMSLYLGWVVSWGILATVLMGKLPFRRAALFVAAIALAFDLLYMPLMEPVLRLHSNWLTGEFLLLILALAPSLILAHFTLLDQRPGLRAALISCAFIIFILGVLPFSTSSDVALHLNSICWKISQFEHLLWFGLCFLLGLPGLAAVIEFARIGKGTPIPYDPPKYPVTTGVYAYLRNPMQTSMVLVLLVWSVYLDSSLSLILAGVAFLYSCGLAHWSENVDLDHRFGSQLKKHRASVRPWLPKLHPTAQTSSAKIYFDFQCSSCLEICRWFERKLNYLQRSDLQICDANNWPGKQQLKRVTYIYPDGVNSTQGVRAIASALQHLHIGWAYLGWLIQFPLIHQIAQISMDSTLPPLRHQDTKKEPI